MVALKMVEVGLEWKYWEFVRILRNDERVKSGFIQQEHISVEDHAKYMFKHHKCYFACLADEEFAGYVGVVDEDIRIATHPDKQKLGVGSFMLEFVKANFPTAKAKIKLENEASLKLFQKSGYVPRYYLLDPPSQNNK